MKLLDFIPIKLTLLLISGIVIGVILDPKPLVPLLFSVLSIICLGFLFYKSEYGESIPFGMVVVSTTLGIGLLLASVAQPKNRSLHYSHHVLNKTSTSQHLKVLEVLKPTPFTKRYVAEIQRAGSTKVQGKVLLNIQTDSLYEGLQVDDELITWGTFEEIPPTRNPHQFNYKNYMARQGISHQIRLDPQEYYLKPTKNSTIRGITATFRRKISFKLKKAGFEKDELGIIQALLLGQRSDISSETYDDYKNAGAVHILAVSGLHIGIVLLLLQFLLRPLEFLPKGKTVKLVVIVLLLWSFAFLAGLSASVVRAVTMFSFVAYALYLIRPSNTFNILALSVFFILLVIDPMLLFQVGFQMSYAAVLAIVWIYPKLQRFWFPENMVLGKVWQLLSVSLAAQLGVLPVSLFYFHQFPGLFFISNLLIVPFLGLILGLGIGVIILALLNILPGFLVSLYSAAIKWMNIIVGWVARQEAFIFKDIPFDSVQLVLAYIIIFALVHLMSKSAFKRVVVLLLGILGFQAWSFYLGLTAHNQERVIVLHQTANTVLFHQKGRVLAIHTSDTARADRLATDYKVAERVLKVSYQSIKNSYKISGRSLLVMDSLAIHPACPAPDILLLTQSPKINLERYLDIIDPKRIIADGSNYASYVNRWKKTCTQRKLPFHYTGEKGSYNFSTTGD